MGYSVNGGGTITVRPHQEAEALAALKSWAAEKDQVGYASPDQADEIAAARTVADVFATFGGMDVIPEPDTPGTFDVWHGDSWSEDYDEAATVIGPYVEPGRVEWTGEDDSHWCWDFTGTEMIERPGAVVYDDTFLRGRIVDIEPEPGGRTPAPSARCPFEDEHQGDEQGDACESCAGRFDELFHDPGVAGGAMLCEACYLWNRNRDAALDQIADALDPWPTNSRDALDALTAVGVILAQTGRRAGHTAP